jgi:hypothetical protein
MSVATIKWFFSASYAMAATCGGGRGVAFALKGWLNWKVDCQKESVYIVNPLIINFLPTKN